MNIHSNFTGGNIRTVKIENDHVYLENELRDTTEDWFYWAFCLEGAAGRTLTFHMQPNRLGYWGPAVSQNLENWHWLDQVDGDTFTYTCAADENTVYFAHSMLYHPNRFTKWAEAHHVEVKELCRSRKGRSVPYIQIGAGSKQILLTARHHACESTGSYVLEGVLTELLKNPIPDTTIFCVPFADYDGVADGDQGKSRAPHDHNRDYVMDQESIYPECAAIRKYAAAHGCLFGFDFHAPWHISNENDRVFIVQNSEEKLPRLQAFAKVLEESITEDSLKYEAANDYPINYGWNRNTGGAQFAYHMTHLPDNHMAFTLETTYFGTADNQVTEDKLLQLGHCYAEALRTYMKGMGL